jgi:hypothetical protein
VGIAFGYLAAKVTDAISGGSVFIDLLLGTLLLVGIVLPIYYFAHLKDG